MSKKTKDLYYHKSLHPSVFADLNELQIANVVKSTIVIQPKNAHEVIAYLERALSDCCRGIVDMYKVRACSEGFLLGLIEGANLLEKQYENEGKNPHNDFQRLLPIVFYRLLFKDGSNWEIRKKSVARRFERAIHSFCKGYAFDRYSRIIQVVAIGKAALKTLRRFRGGWHHEICAYLSRGLLDSWFVQDRLDLLVKHGIGVIKTWSKKPFIIPKSNLVKI